MKNFVEQFGFISEYTTKLRQDNENSARQIDELTSELDNKEQRYIHLEAEFTHS